MSYLVSEAKRAKSKLRDGTGIEKPNILFLGLCGVGKTSLVLSMQYALGSKTTKIPGKDNLVATTQLGFSDTFSTYPQEALEHKYACQPRLWDSPGLQDINNRQQYLILQMLKQGMITRVSPASLYNESVKNIQGMGDCGSTYGGMDAIVVVHAATDVIPEDLLFAIRKISKAQVPEDKNVPLLWVITKIDLLEKDGMIDELPNIKTAFVKSLGLEESYVFCTKLYCNERAVRNEDIDRDVSNIWIHTLSQLKPIYTKHKTWSSFIKELFKNFWMNFDCGCIPPFESNMFCPFF